MRVLSIGWRRFLLFLPVLFILAHVISVSQLHQDSIKLDGQKRQAKKFDHLVLGPAAGEGLPNRLQCEGTRALSKIHLLASSTVGTNLPAHSDHIRPRESVAFVTVFTIYNSTDKLANVQSDDHVTVGTISYTKGERSLAILNVFINFIQVSMPESNVIILTDPASNFSLSRDGVTIFPMEGDYSREKLMLQRIKSYIAFLETRLHELRESLGDDAIHYIFTDSDIAVVDDLSQIFHAFPDSHVALTFRNNKEQPLNSGFIAVRGTTDGILRAKNLLEAVLEAYGSKFMKASRMLGDQLALAWVIKSEPNFDMKRFTKQQAFTEPIGGALVLFLPCATHNWTPPEGAGQFHGMPLDVKVVHFKGSRKRLMLEAWNFLNSSSSNVSDMLCLVLKSGRTKYDF